MELTAGVFLKGSCELNSILNVMPIQVCRVPGGLFVPCGVGGGGLGI